MWSLTKFAHLYLIQIREGNGTPLQYSCLEKSHGWRSLVGCSPWGHWVPNVSVHSRGTWFPCSASTVTPSIDSHHGGMCDSPVGKPRGKATDPYVNSTVSLTLLLQLRRKVDTVSPLEIPLWSDLAAKAEFDSNILDIQSREFKITSILIMNRKLSYLYLTMYW